MTKSPGAFRSIGEVSRLVGVAPHVLRYWESQFPQLSPVKRADGRRYYRPDDVSLIAGLYQVLREEGLSIRGAKRLIAADRGAGLRTIGAMRLSDDYKPASTGQRQPSAAAPSAVRLTVPAAKQPDAGPVPPVAKPVAPSQAADMTAGQPAAKAPARKRKPASQIEMLPLFPELDRIPPGEWLRRLVATAAALRAHDLGGNSLPAKAKELRAGLHDSRQA